MRVYNICGIDGKSLRTFVCMDENQAPAEHVWQEFVARAWQMDPNKVEDEISKEFPSFKLVPSNSASCFGPPFFDSKGQLLRDFKFPEGNLCIPNNYGGANIEYHPCEKIWLSEDSFIYLDHASKMDIYGHSFINSYNLQDQNTRYGILVPNKDFLLRVSPFSVSLKQNKTYPAVVAKRQYKENDVFGFVFVDEGWVSIPHVPNSLFVFKELFNKEFYI